MSIEKSYSVTMKIAIGGDGSFESIRITKARSAIPDSVLEQVNQALQGTLVPATPVRTTVAIGDDAEQKVMNYLLGVSSVNMDFQVLDASNKTGHGDMVVSYKGKQFCIEVKCYTKPVPMKEIDKYHRSLALPEYHGGIIIQLNPQGYCAEANLTTPIDIRVVGGKPTAYLAATDLGMIYPIINVLISQMNMAQPVDEDELEVKRRALLSINEKLVDLRSTIDAQKKAINRMESAVEAIAALTIA
jgi:hypothetical protein